jgi:DNA-directed RNA polymerase subunit RPC12/RpoP
MHYYRTLIQESSKQQKHKSNKSHSTKGAAMLKCWECNKEFSSILGLQTHQRHHRHTSSTNKKVYTCNECGKEFGMARNLNVHIRSHHDDHNSEEQTSEDKNTVSEEHHQSEGTKPGSTHVCPICHKDFPDVDNLTTHITLQHFRCPQCGEAFVRQCHVVEHIRKVHSTEEDQYITGDHLSTEMNELEMKKEPVMIKEENEDENIDVSSLTPTGDQQYGGSPEHHAFVECGEKSNNCISNTQSSETLHLNIHNHPSSPVAVQANNSTSDGNATDDETSLSQTPPGNGDNEH